MKKKLNSKKLKLEINSLDDTLLKKLTDQELKTIKGGIDTMFNPFITNTFDPLPTK